MNTAKDNLTKGCIIVAITLALLVGMELAARLLSFVKSRYFADVSPTTILKQEWGKQYVADEAGLRVGHVTYVAFREKAYSCPTINIDGDGRRRVPGSCAKDNALTVMTFGGSTMFGYGVPDQYTIPAHLAEALNATGRCIKVINYGAGFWQSSQSLVQLLQSLKGGARPAAVIFYDGINELDGILSGGTTGGVTHNAELRLRAAFEEPGIFVGIARGSVLIRILRNRIFMTPQKRWESAYSIIQTDMPAHSRAITGTYTQNVRVVDALAREYGFNAYFFLQPFPIISAKKTTTLERAMLQERERDCYGEADFTRFVYRAYGHEFYLTGHPRVFDIAGIFDTLTEELYADPEHLLPRGNRIVAERIAKEVSLSADTTMRRAGQ